MKTLAKPALFQLAPLAALWTAAVAFLVLPAAEARASTAYGSINNFDCVNDTGVECHGFEIELEGIDSADITYTYNWNHYGTPALMEDRTDPQRPKVIVRYSSAKNPDGSWAAYTAIPSGPIAPTDGHQFTNPTINFGGEHFGCGYRAPATNITYHWLVDNGAGVLVRGPAVMVSTPAFTYVPPAAGQPAQVQAVIQPPPPPPDVPPKEFGAASWVKEIRTTSHNSNPVELRDLVSDDPDDPDDVNWRNGEPDEVEVEWQLLQTDFNSDDGGPNGKLEGAPEALPGGDEVITRRYEFYAYVGPLDEETGEAMADRVGPDGIHGVGVKTINGVEVDLAEVEIVGPYLGSQMAAFDVEAEVGLIEHVQDGVAGELYPTRTLVITGNALVTSTNWGELPQGMTFDRRSGALSGTPIEDGIFQSTIEARAGQQPPVRRAYLLTIAPAGVDLPPRSTVETSVSPLNAGTTRGDGSYTNDTPATVIAIPAAGFAFARWTDHGKEVSTSATYTFVNLVHRSLTAHFVPAPPRLAALIPQMGTVSILWTTNAPDFVLQRTGDLSAPNWVTVTTAPTIVGDQNEIRVSASGSQGFFRLWKP